MLATHGLAVVRAAASRVMVLIVAVLMGLARAIQVAGDARVRALDHRR